MGATEQVIELEKRIGDLELENKRLHDAVEYLTRKLFGRSSGSPKGATASATVYSIIESAKANGLNPYKYLHFIFSQLPGVQFGQHPEFLEDYLPWSTEVQEACK